MQVFLPCRNAIDRVQVTVYSSQFSVFRSQRSIASENDFTLVGLAAVCQDSGVDAFGLSTDIKRDLAFVPNDGRLLYQLAVVAVNVRR
jgi:hypothetical protein